MATKQQQMTPAGTKPVTADELLEMHARGMRGELVRGVFCPTMSAGVEHGEIVMEVGRLIGNFAKSGNLGRLIGSDVGVRLEQNPDTIREPDVAYFSYERLPRGTRVTGFADVRPNLAVEVVSPSDSPQNIYDKTNTWLFNGVQMVWVIWPDTQMIEVFRPGEDSLTLDVTDTLDGGEVLPGFSVPVREIFET